jgi:hypothetical protein
MVFWQRVTIIWVLVVCVMAAYSLTLLGPLNAEITEDKAGNSAISHGQVRTALEDWVDVNYTQTYALSALINTSCTEWDIGYRDDAATVYANALIAGAPWDETIYAKPCFVNGPVGNGFSLITVSDFPFLYVSPNLLDKTDATLGAIVADSSDPLWQRFVAAACLDDRSNYKLLAGVAITLGYSQSGPTATGPVLQCINSLSHHYYFVVRSNIRVFQPKDAASRLFLPNSPIPKSGNIN